MPNILKKTIPLLLLLTTALLSGTSTHAQSFGSQVPGEYYPNYLIADDFNEMKDTLSTLEATLKVGEAPTSDLFKTLSLNFDSVFDYFPKSTENTQTYKQCDIITKKLAANYSSADYTTFKNQCFNNIIDIVGSINSSYTIKPSLKTRPSKGSAPLTVTFDAKESTDPSLDTIPERNFFWYYKDIYGEEVPLGIGPIVTHTFEEPGKYIVHLTVRSSNNIEEGIFDGSSRTEVVVDAKAADIVIYLNGKRITTDRLLKIDSQEARDGFVINGSGTQPIGERQILQHTWKITGDQSQNRFNWTDTNEGPPGQFVMQFPTNGVYKIELEIIDNENNKLKEVFEVSVSDPVALMRHTPKQGTTSVEYSFDGSASYSLTSRLVKYQWIIIDPNGEQTDMIEARSFKRKFLQPGVYTVQLTTFDEYGNSSFDIQKIEVNSTDPIPSFQIIPMSNRDKPSQFVFDASGSYDEDMRNGVDSLTYAWTFSNPDAVTIQKVVDEGQKIIVTYDQIGKQKVNLTVRDAYGVSKSVEKNITIESTLRPELFINPITTIRGEEVKMISKSNQKIGRYSRDFGDGKANPSTTTPEITHIYEEAGIYPVTLTVATIGDGEQNSVTKNVFVGQKDEPTIAYEVKTGNDQFLQKAGECEDPQAGSSGSGAVDAYIVTRYEQAQFSLAESINAQGKKTGLKTFIQPESDDTGKIFEKNNINYSFSELGCHYLDVTVQDEATGKEVKERVRFDVKNNPPTIGNVVISFPQSNEVGQGVGIGAGLQQTQKQQETFGIDRYDPLMVKVSTTGVRDEDGQISRYIRYYYNTKDPEERENIGVTPASAPFYTFSVPRVAGEYAFGVTVVDNDNQEVNSTDLLGKGPVITFSQQGNPDVPLVDLEVSNTDVAAGEEVIFTVGAEILSKRSDFESNRYFKYDLDGDGTYDTPPIKEDTYTHIYDTAGTYNPKVKVVYREKVGVDMGPEIRVKQGVRHQILTDHYDKTVLIKNSSIGELDTQLLCLDINNCPPRGPGSERLITDPEVEVYTYDEYGDYTLRLISIDAYGNKPTPYTPTISITTGDAPFYLLSIPQPLVGDTGVELTVGSKLDNTISFYPIYNGDGNCFIDTNITVDSDKDSDPLYDPDIPCNELTTTAFDTSAGTLKGNIYYTNNNTLITTPISISFLDAENQEVTIEVPDELQEPLNRLEQLISDVENGIVVDPDGYYYVLLESLRTNLTEKPARASLLLQLNEYVKNSDLELPDDHRERFDILVLTLTDETLQTALGGSQVDQARSNILVMFENPVKAQLKEAFVQIDLNVGNKQIIKEQLTEIGKIAEGEVANGTIDEVDFNEIVKQICEIVFYYEISSVVCGTDQLIPEGIKNGLESGSSDGSIGDSAGSASSDDGRFSGIVKRVIIGVAILILIFIIIVVIFAIKAKRGASEEE